MYIPKYRRKVHSNRQLTLRRSKLELNPTFGVNIT